MSENGEKQKESGFALMVRSAANLPESTWSDERIAVVKRTIAPPEAGASEIAMFLAVAARYDLDPFAKEIFLAKEKGRLIIVTGRDAILKVARSNPGYLGHESGVVRQKDKFTVTRKGGDVAIEHVIDGFDRGDIVGAYCLARKEDHPPILVVRPISDYAHLIQHKDNWQKYPEDMITSRVITAAHRLLYNISGMYTPEEMESGEAAESLQSHEVAQRTREKLEALRQKLSDQPETEVATGEPEGDDSEEVDYEIVQGDGQEEFVEQPAAAAAAEPEPEPAKPAPEKAPEKPKAEKAEKTEHQRLSGRFWALYGESYDQDDVAQEEARRAWLQEHFGKRSFGQLSTDEVKVAIGLLEERRGPAPVETEAAVGSEADGGMPV